MALCVRSIVKLTALLKGMVIRNCQIIAAVHNPILITAFEDVLSLEKRAWVKSFNFVSEQMNDEDI